MKFRGLLTALVVLFIGATVADSANAQYPVPARKGTTTVTGTYRPIDLNLNVVETPAALSYTPNADIYNLCLPNCFSFTTQLSGTFTGSGFNYGATGTNVDIGTATGQAGNWLLSFMAFVGVTPALDATDDGVNKISVESSFTNGYVGTLTYLGGGNYSNVVGPTRVPYADTPQVNDRFDLYASGPINPFLEITCEDGVALCSKFVMTLLEPLRHVGPFAAFFEGELDIDRLNELCARTANGVTPCGSIPVDGFRVLGDTSTVPEPGSVALVGLALAGLAYGRRRLSN